MPTFLMNIFDNPILMRELRRRMRGKALVYSIISYIILMTISTVLVVLATSPSPNAQASVQMLNQLKLTGERVFVWITGIQFLLVLIIAPTITAGLTTGEKERRTFDFLRVTTITRWMYVLGCFLSTAFYVALALLCALPLLSLTFLYGGVALHEVVRTFFYLLGGSCVLSSFGLYVSSIVERTRTSQGVIVFLIFAMLLGGTILWQEYQFIAGAAATAAGTAGSATGGILVFDVSIPPWVMVVAGMLGLSAIFLLLAARKLFEPEETRAFAHWQFAAIAGGILMLWMGFFSSNPVAQDAPQLLFLALGTVLLGVAVQTFAVGRMEVGDEIWHLKRLLPALRPFDQTFPFLVLVAFAWWMILEVFPTTVTTLKVPASLIDSLQWVSVASFAFLAAFARAMTGFTGSRRRAGLYSMIAIGVCWGGFPLIAGLGSLILTPLEPFWREVASLSPFALLYSGFRSPAEWAPGLSFPGLLQASAYTILALAVGTWGELQRWRRWRHFDYHYDMPVG